MKMTATNQESREATSILKHLGINYFLVRLVLIIRFRPRTQSALSIPCSSSRISPTLEPPGFEDFDLTWMDTETSQPQSNVHVKELLDKTDKMRIDMEDEFRRKLGVTFIYHQKYFCLNFRWQDNKA
jgi:hypothetical protein